MLLSLLFVLSFGAQASCGELSTDIKKCKVDADCTLARELCGNYGAYNKAHVEELKKQNACLAPLVRCAKPKEQDLKKLKVSCRQNQCELVI